LEEVGAEYESVLVDLQDKPQDFCDLYAKANPIPGARAKVPLLQLLENDTEDSEMTPLCESLIVAEYVAERFSKEKDSDDDDNSSNCLLPQDAHDRATMRLFTELCGSSFSYFPLLRAAPNDLSVALDSFKEGLANVDAFLNRLGSSKKHPQQGGPFLFGHQFTLAECNAAPFVQRCCTILPAFTGGSKDQSTATSTTTPIDPLKICDELGLVRLKQWMEAILERPSVVTTGVPEEDMIRSTSRMLERFAQMDTK